MQWFCDCNGLVRSLISVQAEIAARKGIQVDLRRAFWTPPLTARPAFDCERAQIEELGLDPLVSLTDHEDIQAPMLLSTIPESRGIPISLEWTAPYLGSAFHLGIHNLPGMHAQQLFQELLACTAEPSRGRVCDLLQTLHSSSSVLIVLNHPLWRLSQTTQQVFLDDLQSFLGECGSYIHGFELNGLRPRKENMEVVALAARWKQIVISGGDRHGCEPNANINLTNAETFSEWVEEVRRDRCSSVLFLPQYEESRSLRLYRIFLDAIREYPLHAGGLCRWDERTFHPDSTGATRAVASLWKEPPRFLQLILAAAMVTEGSLFSKGIHSPAPRAAARFPDVAHGAR